MRVEYLYFLMDYTCDGNDEILFKSLPSESATRGGKKIPGKYQNKNVTLFHSIKRFMFLEL